MSVEYDDVPAPMQKEVLAFADVNEAWTARLLPFQRQGQDRAPADVAQSGATWASNARCPPVIAADKARPRRTTILDESDT